jgi:hypothetical protein
MAHQPIEIYPISYCTGVATIAFYRKLSIDLYTRGRAAKSQNEELYKNALL